MGTMHRKTGKEMVATGNDPSLVEVIQLREYPGTVNATRIVRLVSDKPLTNAKVAAQVITQATKFAQEFKADLLVTPAGFGEVTPELRGREIELSRQVPEAVRRYVADLVGLIPASRHFDIVLGVDGLGGYVQDAYFIPREAHSVEECHRAWKSYPTSDEMDLCTKGKPCSQRVVSTHRGAICILVCHDLAAFSARSQKKRGQQREKWARQIDSEVPRDPNTGIVHLIHFLDRPIEGKVFTNVMQALIRSGAPWGISTFKTKLYRTADRQALRKIEDRTARFAGPTLDLYVSPIKSKTGGSGENR